MRTVDARLRRPVPSSDCFCASSSSEGSVGGVVVVVVVVDDSDDSVFSEPCDESEEPPKLVFVTDSERTRGSSGTGLSGCEVDDMGTLPDCEGRWAWYVVGLEAAAFGDSAVWGRTACTR